MEFCQPHYGRRETRSGRRLVWLQSGGDGTSRSGWTNVRRRLVEGADTVYGLRRGLVPFGCGVVEDKGLVGLVLNLNLGNDCAHLYSLTGRHEDFGQGAVRRRRHLHAHLVGDHFRQRFVLLDPVTYLLEPSLDDSLGDRLPYLGQRDLHSGPRFVQESVFLPFNLTWSRLSPVVDTPLICRQVSHRVEDPLRVDEKDGL